MTAASHGGKRPNAGRKPRKAPEAASTPPAAGGGTFYPDAESYLAAIVEGREPPDALRIQAAKSILPFQKRRQRAPLAAARTPKGQAAADESQAAADLNQRFRGRVAELSAARKLKGA